MQVGLMLWLIGIPLAIVAATYLYWQLVYPARTYRYKLTVEVETPQGVRTGSAVREITWRDGPRITLEGSAAELSERGEAVSIDLPNGETLFALLYWQSQGATARLAFGTAQITNDHKPSLVRIDRPDVLSPVWGQEGYPRFVRFRDLSDPTSVEIVDPANLTAIFGQGYNLKSITAQLTSEAVTRAVTQRLHAAGWTRGQALDRTKAVVADRTLAQQLGYSDFSKGIDE